MHAAITHVRAGNLGAVNHIINNARGPVATLTKISQAYLHMQNKVVESINLFLEVMPDHARFEARMLREI